jgi:hypothetical protein
MILENFLIRKYKMLKLTVFLLLITASHSSAQVISTSIANKETLDFRVVHRTELVNNEYSTTKSKTRESANKVPPDPLFRLLLAGMGLQTELIIRFKAAATVDYDIFYDAILFPSGNPSGIEFASVSSDNYDLVINSLPLSAMGSINVPLFTTIGFNGSCSIDMTQFINFLPDYNIVLKDLKLGINHDMNSGTYVFNGSPSDGDSRFEMNISQSVLPIELLFFDSELANSSVKLRWATLTEINNDYFIVEKSSNGINFEEMSIVPGSGNSQEVSHYSIIDDQPNMGLNYYRLKQTDFNNNQVYIGTVQVKYIDESGVTLYPNPVLNNLRLTLKKQNINTDILIEINNSNGAKVSKQNIKLENCNRTLKVKTNELTTGIYYVHIIYNDKIETHKFLKVSKDL